MEVYDIIKEYLEKNGYTALCGDDCGCSLDDFMPCGGDNCMSCTAGYKNDCIKCEKRDECDIYDSSYDFMCCNFKCNE